MSTTPQSIADGAEPPPPSSADQQQQQSQPQSETAMSPEEETSASPTAGAIPGSSREPEEPRMSSPPSGSKFVDQAEKPGDDSWGTTSDVEKFDGKIVYNQDGSAYIIEDSELSEEDPELPQMLSDGCIVDGRGVDSQYQIFPQIANAFYVSRNTSLLGHLYPKLVQEKKLMPEVPVMHSYRVFSVREKTMPNTTQTNNTGKDCSSVPVKPILMCFICKLSFGYSKSFVAHALGDHNLILKDEEKDILGHKNASAIIQCVGKEKEPLVSFLEPMSPVRPVSDLRRREHLEEKAEDLAPSRISPQKFIESQNSSQRMNCGMDLTRKSPANEMSPGASPSPSSNMSPLMNMYNQHPPNFLTGTTIGVCPDHMGGRPSGVECPKCELILTSSRLGVGGPLAGMHSRNSCKTLKCPKCNWHYKYQETLEIHMKEKHPETETSCIYCIAGQPHPRLARGETYTCGYKPYRCEVCNYSTTTKGNLSIHMQSDKHLNNMQELQNGGVQPDMQQATPPPKPSGMPSPAHHSPIAQSQKPKPTFRCDVCNYETNVARNLRIHMTSEKHTHNMMVLQQNVKQMQTFSALQQSHQQQLNFEALLHFHPGLTLPGDKPPPHTEAALADMAYNQALLIQMMTGGQMPPHIPPELAPHMDMGLNPETMEPPPEPAEPNPEHLFHCCVCNVFSTDSLEALSHHLAADRTKIREQEILALVAGHYVCKLCTYKTNLKANFQLHCKTDKHLQRLQHVNHVKEGGPRNEWKLKYVSSPGGVQVRCHACDYYTNSAHKLQLHAAGQRHEASQLLFRHLRDSDSDGVPKVFHCVLCGFSARARLPLLQHVRSMKHLQMEQLHQLQRRSEGKELQADITEVFQVIPQPQDTEQGKI